MEVTAEIVAKVVTSGKPFSRGAVLDREAMTPGNAASILTVALLVAACGGSSPPPKVENSGVPLTDSSATAAAPAKPATSDAPAAPPPAASSAAPEKKPKPPASSGAPIPLHASDTGETTTFAAAGGKIRIGGAAELFVQPGSVDQATNFTFTKNTGKDQLKITPYKGQIGEVFKLGAVRPDGPKEIAGVPAFVLRMPLPKGTKTANLVVALPAGGTKGAYTVLAPTKVDEGDTPYAYFDVMKLAPEAIVHLTSAAPTEAPR